MQFSRSFLFALVSVVLAQSGDLPNPFTLNQSFSPSAGQSSTITWTPTTDGTISLYLRDGNTADLNAGTPIATGLPNNGRYTWDVPSDAVRCSQCTIEIVDDSDTSEVNYSGRFILSSPNNAAPTSSGTSTMASVTSASSSSASSNSESTSQPTPTSFLNTNTLLSINTNPPTAASTSATDSSSSSSETATVTSDTSSSGTTPTSSGTNMPSSTNADLVVSSTTNTDNSAPRATAMIGMLGAVALGALAL